MISVINLKFYHPSNMIYIGRYNKYANLNKSILANPFKITDTLTREESIAKYKNWLLRNIEAKTAVYDYLKKIQKASQSRDILLGCWCKPEACHGDVIKEILETRKL